MRKGKGKSIHVLIDKRPRSSTKVTIDHDSSFFSTSYLSKENFVAAWNVMSAFLINFFVEILIGIDKNLILDQR